MTDSRQVKVTLVIDSSGAVKTMRDAGSESSKTESKFQHLDKGVKELGKSFGGLKNMIGLGLGALGFGGVAYGIKDIVSGMQEAVGETEKFHTITGIGAQASLGYTAALKARGIGAEAGGKAFKFLAKNLQTAERQWHTYGGAQMTAAEKGKVTTGLLGIQANAFKELRINLTQFMGLSEQGKLETITKAFEGMADGVRKTRLETQIFGRGGTSLSTVLQGGALGLTAMTKAAQEFFPTIKLGNLEELQVQTARSNLAFEGLKFTLGMQLVPVILEVDKWFVKTIKELEHGHGTWGVLERDVEGVVKFSTKLWQGFEKLVGPTKAVESAVGGLVGVMVVSKVASFVTALSGMGPALLGIAPELAPLALALAGIYETYKHINEINEFLHPTVHIWKNSKGEYEPFHGQKQGKLSMAALQEEAALGGRPGASTMAKEVAAEAVNQIAAHLKVDVHLDGKHFAEGVARNPKAARILAESSAHYTSKMAARGAHP